MSVNVNDDIVACHASIGVRSHLRLNLSPNPARRTDEWRVDPMSKGLTINKNPIASPEELFAQLLQASTANLVATYDGGFDGSTPLDKLIVGDFTIVSSALTPTFRSDTPEGGSKQKTINLESFKFVVGRTTRLGMVPRVGPVLTVNPLKCAVVADDRLVQNATELMKFLLSRLHVNATPYLESGELVKLELETDA